jgi:hypothetical protein
VQCANQHHGEARSGLGSRLASGPYGPASFGPERIGLPFRQGRLNSIARQVCWV